MKILTENREARHNYFLEQTLEAGIALVGSEVTSIRAGKANLKDSYVLIRDGEVFLWTVLFQISIKLACSNQMSEETENFF